VLSAGPSADYRSLDVRVDETKTSPGTTKITSNIPVNILPGGGGFAPLSRDLDTFPLWGGTWIVNPDSGVSCSSGFTMLTDIGQEVLSTAAHCLVDGSDTAWGDPRETKTYGFESRRDFATDSMFLVIDPS